MAKITGVNGLVLDAQTLSDPARGTSYLNGTKIENTTTGEQFTVSGQEANTVEAVYTATRPLDWLPMIMPQENEIYMLFHLCAPSSLIAFSATGCSYTVELGTVINGQFSANSAFTQTKNSGATYENELLQSDFGDALADGTRQCMIRITGENITQFSVQPHSAHSSNTFVNWNIVEWWGKCPQITSIVFSSRSSSYSKNLNSLRYIRIVGDNKINVPATFASCMGGLTAILEYNVSSTPSAVCFDYFLYNCTSLQVIPPLYIPSSIRQMHCAFLNNGLKSVKMTFAANTSVSNLTGSSFSRNPLLEDISGISTENVTGDIDISNNYQLKKLYFDTGCASGILNATNNYTMYSLLFNPLAANAPNSISATYSAMDKEALIAMFNSLPTAPGARTLTITGSRGAAELTAEDIAAATEKNWTVVI